MKKNGEMELTDKMIEEYADTSRYGNTVFTLASALQAERAKPKVWGGAPNNAVCAEVCFYHSRVLRGKAGLIEMKSYTRTLPKTRAREIAEEYATEDGNYCKEVADKIEAAILKREAELTEAGE